MRAEYFRHVSDAEWNDWRWQQAHRVRSVEVLEQILVLTDDERQACVQAAEKFAMAITPYYASLMDREDPTCPVRRQAVPLMAELVVAASEPFSPANAPN